MSDFLLTAFIYLAAAVIAVPFAKRLGLGSVLGYLIAGVVIGPHLLGLVGGHGTGTGVQDVAEFGVVMMLFLIGLELQPSLLWRLRVTLVGLGGLQLVLTAAAVAALGVAVGFGAKPSLAAGLVLAMSSTAIVLQSLQEKQLLKTPAGQSTFGVLLFQDVAVIPILAFLPLLATAPIIPGLTAGAPADHGISRLPGWAQAVVVLAVVGAIVALGRFVLAPVFRIIATTHLRELFTATALLLVVGVALLMEMVGLSPALGTFLAGVVLANSEYRHELEADIEPFKGLLLGLFFITVGAGIDFNLLAREPALIASLVVALLAVKFLVLFGLARAFRLATADGLLFGLALAQGGEFGFVLLGYAQSHGVMTPDQAAPLVATIALSMAVTPLLFVFYERALRPRFAGAATVSDPPPDSGPAPTGEHPVIIAGFGRFGHIVGRMLRANQIEATVLDHDSDQVEVLRQLGLKVHYGDALRLELLHAAGAARAKVFVITLADRAKSLALVALLRQHFPRLVILARAVDRTHAYELIRAGVEHVYRETLGSSLDLGVDALRELGFPAYQARRQSLIFRRYDERALRDLARVHDDKSTYFTRARQHISNLDQIMRADLEQLPEPEDSGWDPPPTGDTTRD